MDAEVCHIVAMSENRVIGANGSIPWHYPSDLKRFKSITMGHPVVMGRKTFQSIGGPLEGRENLVISRSLQKAEGVSLFKDISSAFSFCHDMGKNNKKIFVIGGGSIYRQTMDIIDTIEMTIIKKKVDGDTYYPEVDDQEFKLTSITDKDNMSFLTYKRN